MDTIPRRTRLPIPARLLAVFAGCALVSAAWADQASPPQPPPGPPAPASSAAPNDFGALLERLNSADYGERQAASTALANIPGGPEEIARRIRKGASYTPEQWARLDDAMMQRFLVTPRGGLGASLNQRTPRGGVELAFLMDAFPAAKVLRAGDTVIAAEGVQLTAIADSGMYLRALIISHDPGETLSLTIVREGRTMDQRVPLGSYADLASPGPMSPDIVAKGWELRRERLGVAPQSPKPITVRVTPVDWPEQRIPGRFLGPAGVVPGGRSAFLPDPDAIRRVALSPDAAIQQRQLAVMQKQQLQQQQRMNLPRDRAADQKRFVQQRIQQEYTRIELYQMQLRDPGVKPEQRAFLQQSITDSRGQIELLEKFLRQLEGR